MKPETMNELCELIVIVATAYIDRNPSHDKEANRILKILRGSINDEVSLALQIKIQNAMKRCFGKVSNTINYERKNYNILRATDIATGYWIDIRETNKRLTIINKYGQRAL